MPKKLKPYDDGSENGFSSLPNTTNEEIKAIRKRALDEISEAKNCAGAQVRLDFVSIGWKKWLTRELTSEGQFERLEQSVVDTQLKIVKLYEQAGSLTLLIPKECTRGIGRGMRVRQFRF